MNCPTWDRLVALAWSLSKAYNIPPNAVFGCHGLYLLLPPHNQAHDDAPQNIIEFAWTGGDGVEFSFVGSVADDSPILMNVPCNSSAPNLIVGDNLKDFLNLGCLNGFFYLEQLVYRYHDSVSYLDQLSSIGSMPQMSHDPAEDSLRKNILSALRAEFQCAAWHDHHGRLQELKERHLAKLILPL